MSIRVLLIVCCLVVPSRVRADGEKKETRMPMSKAEPDLRAREPEGSRKLATNDPRPGLYVATFTDNDVKDRAAGRGGSGKRVRASLELRKVGDKIEVTYAIALVGKPPAATAVLSDVQLIGDSFHAAPIAIKAAWPLYLPPNFEGRFTAPGVLTLDGKNYEKVADKTPARH